MASYATRQHLTRYHEEQRCPTFKFCYTIREEALEGAERAMDAGKVSPGCHLMPYHCDRCQRWHIRNVQIVPVSPADLSRRAWRSKKER